ncbi:MAG: hypothetical protein QG671_3589 [Actinomycetota bacterium]|nr:hypothetical protein [Actinomycetota bacterium]
MTTSDSPHPADSLSPESSGQAGLVVTADGYVTHADGTVTGSQEVAR